MYDVRRASMVERGVCAVARGVYGHAERTANGRQGQHQALQSEIKRESFRFSSIGAFLERRFQTDIHDSDGLEPLGESSRVCRYVSAMTVQTLYNAIQASVCCVSKTRPWSLKSRLAMNDLKMVVSEMGCLERCVCQ